MAGRLRRIWYGDPTPTPERAVNARALTAAAAAFQIGRDPIVPVYDTWQAEVWAAYEEVAELFYGIRWLGEMISRVRLVAAKVPPVSGDEPEIVDSGAPAELIQGWAGGIGGQAQLLRRLVVQLSVPGEGWLIGEPGTQANGGTDTWTVRSADELKRSTRRRGSRPGASGRPAPVPRTAGSVVSGRAAGVGYGVEVVDENSPPHKEVQWRLLPDSAFVARIWNPHDRWFTQADSPARHARQVLKELTLANRYIVAQFLSRLASAGVFFLPSEATFPTRPEFADEPDPLAAEWIATAAEAIKHPGAASAVVPILMQLPAEVIAAVKHVDFTTAFDERILDKRDGAISRLATVLDVPKEVLLGMGDVNHWCVDGQTEILTRDGWRTHDRLRVGDLVVTFNRGTGRAEWQSVDDLYRAQVVDEPMLAMDGPEHSSLTTLQHRWPVAGADGFRRSCELTGEEKLIGYHGELVGLAEATMGRVGYSGTIWCPVTGNQTWLARRHGTVYYTGNTSWQIEESGFKMHIAPRMETIVDAFTTSWFRPMLGQANGTDPAEFLVWFDPSEIVVRPDKSEQALSLYDRGELTGEGLRRETGLDESDKPEGDDLKEWLLKQIALGKGGPGMVPVAYKELTGEELEAPAPAAPAGGPPGAGDAAGPATSQAEPPQNGATTRRQPPPTQGEPPPAPDEDVPVAAGARMRHPLTGWPMERRQAGWVVRNVDHDLQVPATQTHSLDVRWRRLYHAGRLATFELPAGTLDPSAT